VTRSGPVGFWEKLAYSMGGVSNFYMGNLLPLLALPIFSVGLGVEAWKVGLAMAVPRVWDAVTDPIMGHISDSWRGRWGRRRPFLLLGSLAVLLTFGLLWLPTSTWGSNAIFWWFLIVSMLYYTAFTIFSIPYIAIGYEIATDSKERTKLMTFRSFVSNTSGLLMPWFYAMCFWNWSALTADGALAGRLANLVVRPDGNQLEAPGYQIVGIGLAVFMALTGCCTLFCRENPQAVAPRKSDFFKSFKLAFSNRTFLLLIGSLVFAMLGIFLVMPLATYVNIYHLFNGDQAGAAAFLAKVGTVQAVFGIAVVPFCGYIITRRGAARMMKTFLLVTAVGFAIKYWTYTPLTPWLQIIPLLMWSFGWTGTMLAFNVMLGDVCDYDDYNSGARREGMYGAIQQLLTKLIIAIATAVNGFMLSFSGIVAGSSEQTPHAVWLLRIEFSSIPFLTVLVAGILFFFYPLTDEKADSIREALALRVKNKRESS
jgi:GPH family glycoside/pentoside/hexuronide:cation symporter